MAVPGPRTTGGAHGSHSFDMAPVAVDSIAELGVSDRESRVTRT